MNPFNYEDSPYPIRADLQSAYREYWANLARPGNWWTGPERVAIAQETRNATQCEYCKQRKQALSPYSFAGEHHHSGALDRLAVDAVHRIVTDQSRITQAWIDTNAEQGLNSKKYVELLGIVVVVYSIDEFNRALGLPLESLPEGESGEPDLYRPAQAKQTTGFVPMLPEDGATGLEADLWGDITANVLRALSVVPDAVRSWVKISSSQYLAIENMMNFSGDTGRSINRMQIELVAGRVSAINECFY